MKSVRLFVFVFTVLVLAAAACPAAPPSEVPTDPDKELVIDGSVVHDVGRTLLNITNWGLIGSHYTAQTTYSHAPSARWPGATGVNHLWSAGIWIGAQVLGDRRVTTGQYQTELLPSDAPEDTIYELYWNAPNAARFPLPAPDDDGDGAEDEDPFNGRDDDGDGAVDEDGAGVSEQHFRCEYDDTRAAEFLPDHQPLPVQVVQQSYQWPVDDLADIVGFDFTIRNIGVGTLNQVYIGMFSDFDVDDPEGGPNEAADDLAGSWAGLVQAYPDVWAPVDIAYMHEGGGATVSGYAGWVILDHPTDQNGEVAPVEVGRRSIQMFSGQLPFDQGGDPTNDDERYVALSFDTSDPDAFQLDDYRVLLSVGPFAELAPEQEMTVSLALVLGADLDEMLRNAARARLLYEGIAFDRDGDPGNGEEFVVNWLGPEEIPVSLEDDGADDDLVEDDDTPLASLTPVLHAAPNPFNPTLEIRAQLPRAGAVRISILDLQGREVRVLHDGHRAAGESRWLWDGRDTAGRALASGVYLVRLATPDRVARRSVTLVR